MRIGSLFSGAGGLDMAVEAVFGGRTVWQCELGAAASKVLEHRWSGVPNLGDITKVDWAAVEPVDAICAGWPCQPWSSAGKKKGAADERALWPEVARSIRHLRPRIVLLENVADVVVRGELARAIGDLASIGYDSQWTCLRASDVGAPHRRDRAFVVATDTSGDRLTWCPELHSGAESTQSEQQQRQDTDRCAVARGDRLTPSPRSRPLSARGGRAAGDSVLPDVIAGLSPAWWGVYEPAVREWERVIGRTAPKPGELGRNDQPRLRPEFPEWMMGWPAGWVTAVPGVSRSDQLRIIGNGVVPQQAEAALHWLLSIAQVVA